MLRVIERTPARLILRERRISSMVSALGFLAVSLLVIAATLVQALQRIQLDGGIEGGRAAALLVFMSAEAMFVLLAVGRLVSSLRGVTLAFDREGEQVTLSRGGLLRGQHHRFSIYGVSHLRVEQNTDTQTLAMMLVLRSGQQHLVTTAPHFEQSEALAIVQEVRAILRG